MAQTAPATAASTQAGARETEITPAAAATRLAQQQARLDAIRQRITPQSSDSDLGDLYTQTSQLNDDAGDLLAALTPLQNQLRSALEVLGPAPAKGSPAEAPELAKRRADLNRRKTTVDTQVAQVQDLRHSLSTLSRQITNQRRRVLRSELARPTISVLDPDFWSPALHPGAQDRQRLGDFAHAWGQALTQAWSGPRWPLTSLLVLAAILIWLPGLRWLEAQLSRLCIQRLPVGRLRRSALAMAVALSSVLAVGLAAELLYLAFARQLATDDGLTDFARTVRGTAIACALVAGLGRALLSVHRPSWRLPAIPDPVANVLGIYPTLIAVLAMAFGTLEQINSAVGTSLPVTIFGNGLVSLILSVTLLTAVIRARRIRRQLNPPGESSTTEQDRVHLLPPLLYLVVIISLGALLLGYISLARFMVYEMIWFFIVIATGYLLDRLATDICQTLINPGPDAERPWLSRLTGLPDDWLDASGTVLTAIIHVVLVMLCLLALFGGHFDNDPATLFRGAMSALGGEALKQFRIMPMQVLDSLLALILGGYLLRTLRHWLEDSLLPKTRLDTGMQASLVMLVTNIGYVVIALAALNALGIEWERLAWIVSALSVGIGFGLQEIVKNFISGLILLTERPIRVGDMISIAGPVQGDVQRINVRATEILLSDKSTVIVPNSQLISGNVRNITMGHAQGLVTIAMTFPLDTDPAAVKDILLDCFAREPTIVEQPATSVSFTDLNASGMTLSVTGYVASPRQISASKSALLFEILRCLREHGIALSSPQSLVIQNNSPATPEPARADTGAVLPGPATDP